MSVVANVAINVDSRNAVTKLRQVQSQSQATERAVNGLGAAVGKLVAAFSVIQAAQFVFVKTAEIETQTRSLQVLTGSAQKAGQIVKELQQLGSVTPFTSSELIETAKRLQAFGVATDKVVETTRRLADVSGATGAELEGLALAYGQVQAKGRLQGEELLQFQERGVALQQELRKMYQLSGDEFQKALEKGRISAEAVEVAIVRLTEKGGKYANGAVAQSDTLSGRLSTLQDNIDELARNIGQTLAPQIKNVLNLAIEAVSQVNKLLGSGMAADFSRRIQIIAQQLTFGLRGAALQGTGAILKEIQAAPQKQNIGGIEAQLNALNAVQNQLQRINAQGLPQNVYNDIMRQQEAITSLRAQLQGYLADLQKAQKPGASTQPKTPDLLGEDKKTKGRQLSVDELLGGDIQRQLRDAQARLAVATQANLNVAAQQPNAEQAKRIVDFTSKLLNIKYQIDAVDSTIAAREKIRAQFIASAKDKSYATLAFDEQTNDLKAARVNLESEVDKLMLEQLGKAQEQYRQEQQAINAVLAGLEMQKTKVTAVTEAQQQAIQFLEIENQLKSRGITLSDEQVAAIRRIIAETAKLTKQQQEAQAKLQMEKDLYQGIADTIAGAFSGAIDAAVKGTESLGEALKGLGADLLATIGKMLIMYGIAQGLGALGGGAGNPQGIFSFLARGFGFKEFAEGGFVTGPTNALIGEGGEPEYVIPASKMRTAMARYSGGARGDAVISGSGAEPAASGGGAAVATPIDVRYTVERINSVDYVTADQFQRGMAQAAEQGARQGERRALYSLRQNTNVRKSIGV